MYVLGIGENEIAPTGWEINNLARTGALSVFKQFARWIAWLTAGRSATGGRAAAISSARGCKCCVLVHGWGGAGVRCNAEAGSCRRRVAAGFVYLFRLQRQQQNQFEEAFFLAMGQTRLLK